MGRTLAGWLMNWVFVANACKRGVSSCGCVAI